MLSLRTCPFPIRLARLETPAIDDVRIGGDRDEFLAGSVVSGDLTLGLSQSIADRREPPRWRVAMFRE